MPNIKEGSALKPIEKEFEVAFDFTIVQGKMFKGKSGVLCISTTADIEIVKQDTEHLEKMAASYIHSQKPKWNIFMITIKEITETN